MQLNLTKAESPLSELSALRTRAFTRAALNRADPCKERFSRYTPAKNAFFLKKIILLAQNIRKAAKVVCIKRLSAD